MKRDLQEKIDSLPKITGGAEKKAALDEVTRMTNELNEAIVQDAAARAIAAERATQKNTEEAKQFSFLRFMQGAMAGKLEGFEAEMDQEARKEVSGTGRTIQGFAIPSFVLRAAVGQSTLTPADGGVLVEKQPLVYYEQLRNKLALVGMGATYLSDLRGILNFGTGTDVEVTWADEAESVDNNEKVSFSSKEFAPKRLVITTAFTKDLLLQTSIDVERLLMEKMVSAHAQGLQRAAIMGDGVKQPLGILNMPGIGVIAIGANGGNIDWAKIVALETLLGSKNADLGRLGYLTNSKVMGMLKTTELTPNSGRFLVNPFAEDANNKLLNGYPIDWTNAVPSNLTKGTGTGLSAMIFGNWQDLYIGQWGGLDVVVDPYSLKKSAQVETTINAWHNVMALRDESFAAIKDITTNP